jgi:SWI/SNF-related matrix-associated actin-dependent regulator 1 of chromatin subfamily A
MGEGWEAVGSCCAYLIQSLFSQATSLVQEKGEQMNVTLQGNRISIAFPFDMRLLEIVRKLPDRAWNHKQLPGVWSVPATPFHCASVIQSLTPQGFYIDPEIEKCADAKADRPKLSSKLPKSLYGYQKEAVEFTEAGRGRVIIGDAPGVGKSAPAIVWANLFGGDRILLVAPANVTWKWAEKEIALWAGDRTWQVVEGGKTPIKDVDITIMSYRMMVNRYEELKNLPFDTMIFDEAHALKSNKSQQNRVARKLVKGVPYLLFITGTAFKNKRFEMFQLLHMLDPKVWSNAIEFGTRYCGGVFSQGHWVTPPHGETNTEELQARLAPILLRRTKMQVANDLPDLTRVSIPITIANIKDYETTLRSVKEQARRESYKPARALTLLNTLRQVVGKGKVKAAIELAEDLLESGEQVVLFAHHREVVEELKAALWSHRVGVIAGDTKPKDRQALANAFLGGRLSVMIVSSAGKEGLDLYSASHLIFVERLWTPADEEQIEARLHRNGQKNAVTAHYLIAKGTVDERLDEIVRSKRAEFANLIESDIIREVFMGALVD